MTFSGRQSVIGFKKQVAVGTPATAPAYEIPLGGGSVGPIPNLEPLPWTADSQAEIGHFVSHLGAGGTVNLPFLPISHPLLLEFILGQLLTTGPVSSVYTHAGAPLDDMPVFTTFYKSPDGNYFTIQDCKMGDWSLNGKAGQPLSMDCNIMGRQAPRSGTKWSAATLVEGVDNFLTFIGADIRVDVGATPATTQIHNVDDLTLSVNRNIDAIQTDGFYDQYHAPNKREVVLSMPSAVAESTDFFNSVHYGSASGTTQSTAPLYGAAKLKFSGVSDATKYLEIALNRVLYMIEQTPEADPSGGTVRYGITGAVSQPSSGSQITTVTKNTDSGANY
jgi:hypothetical protein